MPDSYSFDVVSEVDMQEVDNALNQVRKELPQRYDLRGSNSSVEFDPKGKIITVQADGEHFVSAIREIVQQKCFKRGISIVSLVFAAPEQYGGKTVRQKVTIKSGLEKEDAKKIVAAIKEAGIKVNAQIQDAQVRVTGKNKDDLQKTIALLKSKDFDIPLQFENYR